MRKHNYRFTALFFAIIFSTPANGDAQYSTAIEPLDFNQKAFAQEPLQSNSCVEMLRARNYSISQIKRVKVQGTGTATIFKGGEMSFISFFIQKNPPSMLQASIYRDDKVIATCELEYSQAGSAGEDPVSASAILPETLFGGQGSCDLDPYKQGRQSGLMKAARGDILVFSYLDKKKKKLVPMYVTEFLIDCETSYAPGPGMGATRGKSPDEAWFNTPTKKLQSAVKAFQKRADSLWKK